MRCLPMRVQRRLIFEFFDRYEGVTPVDIDIKIEANAAGFEPARRNVFLFRGDSSSSFPGFNLTVQIILRIWATLRDPRTRNFAQACAKGKSDGRSGWRGRSSDLAACRTIRFLRQFEDRGNQRAVASNDRRRLGTSSEPSLALCRVICRAVA